MNNSSDYLYNYTDYLYQYPFPHDYITPNPKHILPPPFPGYVETIFTVVYVLIMIFALSGNTLVILVILGNKSLRNVTNMFLISLAISDILISGFNVPMNLLYNFDMVWKYGEAMCKIVAYTTAVNVVASIMTLTAVALER
jgi:hypothetical protein